MSGPWNRLFVGLVLTAGLAAGLSGCAGRGGGDPQDAMSWHGASVDDLTRGLGQPESRYVLASGQTVLQYRLQRTVTTGGYTTTPDGGIYGGSNKDFPRIYQPTQTVALICVAEFTIGTYNRVQSVNTQGDGC